MVLRLDSRKLDTSIFSLVNPPLTKPDLNLKYFWSFEGENENVLASKYEDLDANFNYKVYVVVTLSSKIYQHKDHLFWT